MKNFRYFFLMAIITLVSCSSDDDQSDRNPVAVEESSFQARINGVLFNADFCRFGISGSTFWRAGGVLPDGRIFSIFISLGSNVEGTYPIRSDRNLGNAHIQMYLDGVEYAINGVTPNDEEGELRIFENRTARTRGQFNFTISQPGIPRIEVTEGQFDVFSTTAH